MKLLPKLWTFNMRLCNCSYPLILMRTYSLYNQKMKNPLYEVGRTVYQRLNGRDLLSFDGYTKNDIYSLLWIATELKCLKNQSSLSCSNKRIGLVWSNPVVKASLSHSSKVMNASLYCIHEERMRDSSHNYEMLGRSLAYTSDIIFLDTPSWNQSIIEELAAGSHCPVITLSSKELSPGLAMSELLTLFEKYEFLRRLVVAYIGSGDNPMLNTYFTLLPVVGAHLRMFLNGPIDNSSAWEKGLKLSSKYNTEIKQLESLDDAVYRAHTISTCFQETPLIGLRMKDVKEMDLDWSYLQSDSYKGLVAPKEFLRKKDHTLISDVINNQSWIFQALVTGYTTDYMPTFKPPRFEGVD